MPSTVERSNAGLNVFAARTISKGKNIGAYYGLLVYTDLFTQLPSIKEYRGGTVEL